MWAIFQTELFSLLSSSTCGDNMDHILNVAYREFVNKLILFLDTESNNIERIRILNLVYIEFDMIKSLELSYGIKKNILKIIYSDKVLSFVNRESELIYRQMEFPKYFINIQSKWESPLYLNPEVINHVDIMENICGYHYIQAITTLDGKSASLNQLAGGFEQLFNFKFADIYKKRDEVIKRKSNKLTGFLDKMKAIIVKNSRDKGYSP
mgnify:CR=1 FL=1